MNTLAPAQQIEQIAIEALTPYAANSRTHSAAQVAEIAASIREFGFTNPVLVDEDGGIIAGHGRVLAARTLGIERVPCIRITHLTWAQRRAYVIADNKLALNAGWNEDLLAQELRALQALDFNIALMGFGEDEITELLACHGGNTESERDPDAMPEVSVRVVTQPGDIWTLGRHRLVCGDACQPETYAALLGAQPADIVWTDPPYNVAIEGAAGTILNDNLSAAKFRKFLSAAFTAIAGALRLGGGIYVAHAESTRLEFTRAFVEAGFKLAGCLIWRKDSMTLSRSDYQWIHEPILYGWKPGAAHVWYGGRKQTTVSTLGSQGSAFVRLPDGRWQITVGEEVMIVAGEATVEWVEASVMRELRPKRSDLHPTMKPVALIARMLRNSARAGARVLDPFGGSGSTLIAAEQLGMDARLIELDPKFCDVIIRRWQDFVGNQVATLESDGRSFEAVAQERQMGAQAWV